ncbi:energy transducer TonB [Methylophilus sp. QUAN]|uniref:energy transducer TonB n=1 Tax=Methylophilus sp. QUAN TaxID=2781020 RepID=UPI001E62D75A|nr:energy transducer TonB [Methylophilus sp. QUAN]
MRMVQRESLQGLSLKPARASAPQLPELSLHRRQLGELAGIFRWSVLATEDWLQRDKRQDWHGLGMLLVVALHAAVIAWLVMHQEPVIIEPKPEPMTVSLITLPAKKEEAPAPEVVPIIKQQPVVKPVVKPKETPVKPIERPAPVVERIVETTPDQPRFEASTQPSAPPLETPVAAAPSKPAPVVSAPPKQEVVEKEEPPKFGVAYLHNPAPEYPRLSKRAGEEGKVLMKVLVSPDGRPESVDVVSSSGFERLDKAAVNAVTQWRFVPGRKGDKTVSAYVNVPLSFSLTQE